MRTGTEFWHPTSPGRARPTGPRRSRVRTAPRCRARGHGASRQARRRRHPRSYACAQVRARKEAMLPHLAGDAASRCSYSATRELELLQRRAYRDQREVRLVVARFELDRPLVQARPRAAVLADRDTQAGSPSRSVRPHSPLRRALARAAAGREEVALLTKRLVSLQQLVFRHLVRLSAAEVHIQRVAARARRGACVRDSIV
jgi:hypothetical protein